MAIKNKVILASASKKRSEILDACGIKHQVMVSKVKEHHYETSNDIKELTVLNARKKAFAVSRKLDKGIVIGADSLVQAGGEILGKPKNKKEAKRYLSLFSGNTISVYTGICVIDAESGKSGEGIERSDLKVKKLSKAEIDTFLGILHPYNKAGGFSIEGAGAIIFDNIKGSYFNILGLPLYKLKELLKKINIEITDLICK